MQLYVWGMKAQLSQYRLLLMITILMFVASSCKKELVEPPVFREHGDWIKIENDMDKNDPISSLYMHTEKEGRLGSDFTSIFPPFLHTAYYLTYDSGKTWTRTQTNPWAKNYAYQVIDTMYLTDVNTGYRVRN